MTTDVLSGSSHPERSNGRLTAREVLTANVMIMNVPSKLTISEFEAYKIT